MSYVGLQNLIIFQYTHYLKEKVSFDQSILEEEYFSEGFFRAKLGENEERKKYNVLNYGPILILIKGSRKRLRSN